MLAWIAPLILLFSFSNKARSQGYAEPVPSCVREFYDQHLYNWISYENTCSTAIHVTLVGISKPHPGALDIKPGGHGSPGLSAKEVQAVGGLRVYACPVGYVAVDSSDRYLLNGVVDRYECKNLAGGRNPSGVVFASCDANPDLSEQKCNVKKLECNANVSSWCEVRYGKEGTQKNSNNRAQYGRCMTSSDLSCQTSQAECKIKIRRCGEGKSCDAHTETCVAVPK